MRVIDQLVYKISGDTGNFNSAINSTEKRVTSFGSTARKVFGTLGIAVSVGLITSQIRKSIQAFAEFEESLAKVSTLFGDVNVDMDKLASNVIKVSSETGLLAKDINEALYSALSAGVEVTEDMSGALDLVEKSAKLARSGFTDTETALSATIKTINAYKLGLDETDRIQKILIQTQNKGIITVGELGQNLAKVTPTAAAFGVTFEDIGAAIATMTAQGLRAEVTTTSLSQVISELGKQGTSASQGLMKAAQGAGIAETNMSDMLESGMSLGEVLNIMDGYAKANGISMVDMFGSIEAGKAALALTGENAATFASNLESMSTEADLVNEGYQKMVNTVAGQTSILRANISNLGVMVGDTLEPVVTSILTKINDELMPDLMGMGENLGNVFGFIVDVAGITARHIGYAFDDIKTSVTKILEDIGLDPDQFAELKVSLKPFGDMFEALKKSLASGDYDEFWKTVAPAWKEGIKLAVILQATSLVLSGLGLVASTFGVAGAVAGMSVAVALVEAQGEDDWKQFGRKMAIAVGAGLIAAGFTKSPKVGLWTTTLLLNFSIEPDEAKRKEWYDAANKDGANWATRFMSTLLDAVYKDSKKIDENIVDGISGAAYKMYDSGEEYGEEFVRGVEKSLGIESPSKVMMEEGEYISEGLVIGATRPKFGQEISDAYNKWFSDAGDEAEDTAEETGEAVSEALVTPVEESLSIFARVGKILDKVKDKLTDWGDEINNISTAVNSMTSAWSYLNQIQENNNQNQLNRLQEENEAILETMEAEGATYEEVQDRKKELDDEYNELKKKYATEELKRSKAQATFQAVIDTAAAIVGFLVDPGGWAGLGLSALAGVTGGAQIAAINSEPLPAFDVGSIRVPETTRAVVHRNEMILPAPIAEQARQEGISIAPSGGGSGNTTFLIYLDGKKIAENTVGHVNSGVYRIDARVVK